ncbi:MAG: VOC family protein [Candidatus Marinimicrobia bacterium]|nr:VOC family protein [Candidatus Neomarinimicrobiota bacterium]
MLAHIGLTINNKNDIHKFYEELLGLETVSEFEISKIISRRIFDIDKKNPITLLKNDNLVLELFYSKKQTEQCYNHIGINIDDRDNFIKKVREKEYPVLVFPRENRHDLIFIEDSSGNKFEVGVTKKS